MKNADTHDMGPNWNFNIDELRNSETKKSFSVQHGHLQDGEIQIFYQKYTWLEFKRMGQRKIQGYEYRFVSLVGS